MPFFRKKPVVIEAQQWFPPGHPQHDPAMLVKRKGGSANPPDYIQDGDLYCAAEVSLYGMGPKEGDIYVIRTGGPNSSVQVYPGDWIITGVDGEKYPCRPSIFAATYEQVIA